MSLLVRSATAAFAAAGGWHVYVVETKSGKFYTGITTDITRRLQQHAGVRKGGAKALRGDPPVRLRYTEPADDRSGASRREAALKKLTRTQKLALCASQPSPWEAWPYASTRPLSQLNLSRC